jgi:signal transduction histidine kinase
LDKAAADERVERLAELAGRTNALAHEVSTERELTAAYAASNPDPRNRPERARTALRQAQQNVDDAVQAVRVALPGIDDTYPNRVRERVRDIAGFLDQIPSLRQITTETLLSPQAGIDKYSQFVTVLLNLNDDLTAGITDQSLLLTARAEAALARAKDQTSLQGAILHAVLLTGRFEPPELEALQSAKAERDSQLLAFRSVASAGQRQAFEDTVSGPEIDRGESLLLRAVSTADDSADLSVRPLGAKDAAQWSDDTGATIDKMRTAEQQLVTSIIQRAGDLETSARRAALIDAALLCVVITLVLAITLIVAQSLVRPLRRLRAGALDVAGNRLPGLVDRLRDPEVAAGGIHVAPIEVDSTDEIGEVARSFDEVHREAVRLASNEALLRGNINAMFVNLSRRSQSLIERQLRLIEDLEQGEQDEDRLAQLFKLDHLATRMRRNSENLLVLGGQDQVRRWNQPVPLIDIVRASLSEVEQYERVGLRVQGDVSVVGPVVNDLVHLVAELVENATVFSPEHTRVTVSGHLLSGGGAMLQITDNGVGMVPDELEAVNWRLANPPIIDASAARRMGLFVVGRLAVRNGIRVELRSALSGGLTAFVLMPPRIIVQGADMITGFTPRRFDMADAPPQAVPATAGALEAGQWGRGAHAAGPAGPFPGAGPGPNPATGSVTDPLPVIRESPLMDGTGPQPVGRDTGPWSTGNVQPQQPDAGRRPPPPPTVETVYPSAVEPARPDRLTTTPAANGGSGNSWEHDDATGPIRREERLPIFDAIESEWFQRRSPGSGGSGAGSSPVSPWQSPGDEGWRTADTTVRAPRASGRTSSGLPKRVPGKNRVPGSIGAPGPAAPPKSAEAMRNRFASFQQGVHRGRAAAHAEDTGEIQ